MRQMVRLHYVILLLIQVIRNDDLIRVLLCINRVLLQADVNLTEAHRRRVGTDGFPECQMVAVLHGTDLLALEIRKAVNRLIRTHDTKSLICHTEQVIASLRINVADQLVKLRIIDLLTAFIERIKHTRQIKHGKITHKGNLRCRILYDKRNIAVGTRFQQIAVAAER